MSDDHPIQDLYNGQLTPEELREAEMNLLQFFQILLEIEEELRTREDELTKNDDESESGNRSPLNLR